MKKTAGRRWIKDFVNGYIDSIDLESGNISLSVSRNGLNTTLAKIDHPNEASRQPKKVPWAVFRGQMSTALTQGFQGLCCKADKRLMVYADLQFLILATLLV